MYLSDLLFENVGPITKLQLSMPFSSEGNPLPLVLVGENGSGKSMLLSYIVDALVEFAKQHYQDIVPDQHINSPYYKYISPLSQKVGTDYSIVIQRYMHEGSAYSYVEKTGRIDYQSYKNSLPTMLEVPKAWPTEGNYKDTTANTKKHKDLFRENTICFFPCDRWECPHWLNSNSSVQQITPKLENKLANILEKPIYIYSSTEKNKSWILDVFLDSRAELIETNNGLHLLGSTSDFKLLQQSRSNVESILQKILRNNNVKLHLSIRNRGLSRLAISIQDDVFIPSLDNLSFGQSTLFNMFVTIVRYSERLDVMRSIELSRVEGIVVVDEVDAHLHSELQYEVLPELIKLFPKVQFILTSHSPLFLLGMKNAFGEEGFRVIEMPSGYAIDTERFSEFERSLEYYRNTKRVNDLIHAQMAGAKPVVYTEGETDAIYIKTAFELLGYSQFLDNIDIKWVGAYDNGNAYNTGCKGLDATSKVLRAHPNTCSSKFLLLYDCDTNKPPEEYENIMIRRIPSNQDNQKVIKGIENLLPANLFIEQFYPKKQSVTPCGEKVEREVFQKMDFLRYICEERKKREDFIYFEKLLIPLFYEFLEFCDIPYAECQAVSQAGD